MSRALWRVACVGLVVAGCSPPDLQRGKQSLQTGDIDAAEADLQPLAAQGYDDAKMQLARVYARRSDPESLEAAIVLYRELLERDPTVAVPLARVLISEGTENALLQAEEMLLKADKAGDPAAIVPLLEIYSDHPERDKQGRAPKLAPRVAKMDTPEAEASVVKWYRRNALADARYAKELIRLCEPAKDRLPDCYIDLVRHYRGTGNEPKMRALYAAARGNELTRSPLPPPVLERFAASLVSDEYPGAPWPEAAYPLLKQVANVSVEANVRMARLLIDYPHLDPQAKPEAMLLKAYQQKNPEAALSLGRLYLEGKRAPADPAKAERFLKEAAQHQPAAHFYLGKLYKRGHEGKPDPTLAAQHFLTAARGGYPRADHALAELFSENRGVRPNLPNAFVFASLASEQNVPESKGLLHQLRASMKPAQLEEGQRLLRQEIAVRNNGNGSNPPPGATGAPPPPPRAEASP
jgi:alginate biosynthesis protein AlgK